MMKLFHLLLNLLLVSFSIGVHIVENEKDWIKAKSELQPDKLKVYFLKMY
jgi:hypothetical protein